MSLLYSSGELAHTCAQRSPLLPSFHCAFSLNHKMICKGFPALLFITRVGAGAGQATPWATLSKRCCPESCSRLPGNPSARESLGPFLPRLVWHRQELCGPDNGRTPLPRWLEKRLCQSLHLTISLPPFQVCGYLQGEGNFSQTIINQCTGCFDVSVLNECPSLLLNS